MPKSRSISESASDGSFGGWLSRVLRLRRNELIGAGLLIALAVVVYWPALVGEFILDDDLLVTQSPMVHAPNGLHRIWFTTEPIDYWPVTNTSFWLEWRLWGEHSTGYHCTNLALHIVDSLLVWLVLAKLEVPGAYLAAVLFAVHPVNVESVAWIAQRKNLLAMLFSLVAVLAYLRSDEEGMPTQGRGHGTQRGGRSAPGKLGGSRRMWYLLSLVAFVLAGLSKGSAAVLPMVLLLIVWWKRGGLKVKDFVRAAPFFALAAAMVLVNVWFQHHGSGSVLRQADYLQRLLGAGGVVWFYLAKALLPVHLLFIYPQWEISAANWLWWLPLAAAIGTTGMLWYFRRTEIGRALFVAWMFFCIALLPVMGFADVGFMQYSLVADHYQHLALIGVVALAAAGICEWDRSLERKLWIAAKIGCVMIVGWLSVSTWRQCGMYETAKGLYETTIASNPECWLAYTMLGRTEAEAGQSDQAIKYYEQALAINPDYADAHYNLARELADKAVGLRDLSYLPSAIRHYEEAINLGVASSDYYNNYAMALDLAYRPEDSLAELEKSIQLDPNHLATNYNLTNAYAKRGRWTEAAAIARHGLSVARADADDAMAHRFEDQLRAIEALSPHGARSAGPPVNPPSVP